MTSKLDKIKDTGIKVFLKDVTFDFEKSKKSPLGPHIHYTTGAASLMDEAFLFKANDSESSQEEKEILKALLKKEDVMDEQIVKDLEAKTAENADLKKQLDDIQKTLAVDKVEKSLADFEIDAELTTEVAGVLVGMDEDTQAVIIKAFTTLQAFETVKEEVVVETELQKSLATEAGADGEGEVVVKTLVQKIDDARKELADKEKK